MTARLQDEVGRRTAHQENFLYSRWPVRLCSSLQQHCSHHDTCYVAARKQERSPYPLSRHSLEQPGFLWDFWPSCSGLNFKPFSSIHVLAWWNFHLFLLVGNLNGKELIRHSIWRRPLWLEHFLNTKHPSCNSSSNSRLDERWVVGLFSRGYIRIIMADNLTFASCRRLHSVHKGCNFRKGAPLRKQTNT